MVDRMEQLAAERRYDAVARVLVISFRDITIPVDEIDWLPYAEPEFEGLRLHAVRLVEVYDGSLPESFAVFTRPNWPNKRLEIDQEYVLVLSKSHAEWDDPEDVFKRWYYNPAQLEAVGGESYAYRTFHAWVVDGEIAWLLPEYHMHYGSRALTHLEAGRRDGKRLSLMAIKDAIETGARNSQLASPLPNIPVVGTDRPTPTPDPQARTVVTIPPEAAPTKPAPSPAASKAAPSASELEQSFVNQLNRGVYDAVAHVRVSGTRRIPVADPFTMKQGDYTIEEKDLLRQRLEVIRTYRGELAANPEVLFHDLRLVAADGTSEELLAAEFLDEDREYVLFLMKTHIHEDELPFARHRTRYDRESLEAIGGEAYSYFGQVWLIDGDIARRVPWDYVSNYQDFPLEHRDSQMSAALYGGESLPWSLLESILDPGPQAQRALSLPVTPEPPTAVAELEDLAEGGRYDAVARVRVASHDNVDVPVTETEWPSDVARQPVFSHWKRSNLEIVETYHGELMEGSDVIHDMHEQYQNYTLNAGQEYILVLVKRWVAIGEHPEDTRRVHYNQTQLEAIGGAGYAYNISQVWIVDGKTAIRIPPEYFRDGSGPHLDVAREFGETVPLEQIEDAIRSVAWSPYDGG